MIKQHKPGSVQRPTERDEKTSDSAYHGVSLKLSANACDAAKALIGRRFLATQAPILPIAGCDLASCSCGYQHHADRRDGPRRGLDMGISGQFWAGEDRRVLADRREEGQRSDGEADDEPTDYSIYFDTGE